MFRGSARRGRTRDAPRSGARYARVYISACVRACVRVRTRVGHGRPIVLLAPIPRRQNHAKHMDSLRQEVLHTTVVMILERAYLYVGPSCCSTLGIIVFTYGMFMLCYHRTCYRGSIESTIESPRRIHTCMRPHDKRLVWNGFAKSTLIRSCRTKSRVPRRREGFCCKLSHIDRLSLAMLTCLA